MREMAGLGYDEIARACDLTLTPSGHESTALGCSCGPCSPRQSQPDEPFRCGNPAASREMTDMNDTHEVISAFLDDEPFDPRQLAQALSEPDGRTLLIDLLALRHVMQPGKEAASFERQGKRAGLRALMAVAALVVALVGGYFVGERRGEIAGPRRRPRRESSTLQPRGKYYPEEIAMRTTAFSLLIVLIACSAASAQTDYDLQIQLGAYVVTPHGGEQPGGVWRSTGPVVIGKPVSSTYSFGTPARRGWSAPDGSFREDATTAWRIEITPIRIVRHAVTFRLRWVRTAGLQQQLDQSSLDAPKPPCSGRGYRADWVQASRGPWTACECRQVQGWLMGGRVGELRRFGYRSTGIQARKRSTV